MVLSSLAAFVFQLPSLSAFLPSIDAQIHDDPSATVTPIGDYITQLDTPSARISHPLAIPILLRLTWSLSNEVYSLAITKLFDRLAAVSYANRATMAGSGIVRLVWDRLYPLPAVKSAGTMDVPLQESHALQKLLRRVIDVGAPLSDLKHIFKRTSSNGSVGLKALSTLKGNPQARWPSFLSFRGEGCGLDVENLNLRGKGISVLVCLLFSEAVVIRTDSLLQVMDLHRTPFSCSRSSLWLYFCRVPRRSIHPICPGPQTRWMSSYPTEFPQNQ